MKVNHSVLIIFIFAFILLVWLFYPKLMYLVDIHFFKQLENAISLKDIGTNYGSYGDAYGSLNTLFTGLAFAGLIISIVLQSTELKETRKEMNDQKNIMEEQKNEALKQNKILENQQELIEKQFDESRKKAFFDQFYALLDQRQQLLNNIIVIKANGEIIKGN